MQRGKRVRTEVRLQLGDLLSIEASDRQATSQVWLSEKAADVVRKATVVIVPSPSSSLVQTSRVFEILSKSTIELEVCRLNPGR